MIPSVCCNKSWWWYTFVSVGLNNSKRMKKLTLRSGFLALVECKKKHKRKHFISRERFLRGVKNFDGDIREECLRRLGCRSRVMLSVAQAILSEASASVQKKTAKTLKGFAFVRFKSTPGFF